MTEIWKEIIDPEYSPGYEISNFGHVRIKESQIKNKKGKVLLKSEKVCKLSEDSNRRIRFCIKNSNGRYVNRSLDLFVAKYFVENPNNFLVVSHIDGDLSNNRADNLEWITAVDNPKYNLIKDLDGEIWKPLEEYPIYMVSSKGRVKSIARDVKPSKSDIYIAIPEALLSPTQDESGYLNVGLSKDGRIKTVRVHRLVASTFLPNPTNNIIVDHIDRDRSNNCVENLRWTDSKGNAANGGTTSVIVTFPDGHTEQFNSILEASAATGYKPGSITTHCSRRSKAKNGYSFRWLDQKSHIGQQNKRKGNDFERKVVRDLKELGYNVVTARSESKRTDDNKIDIIDLDNKLSINLQTKYTATTPNFFKISEECTDKSKPFGILWKKSGTKGANSPGAVAIIPLDYFYKLIKLKE